MRVSCRCIAEDVFLQPVADKFVRLVFQLLARYSSWLTDGLSGKQASTAAAPVQNGTPQASVACIADMALPNSISYCEQKSPCFLAKDTACLVLPGW